MNNIKGPKDRISIVVNTCDRAGELRRCLRSIKKQTYTNYNIILINNGKLQTISDLLAEYPVKVINDNTKRLSYLFNIGWKHADTEIIAYVADDVEVDPEWLENIVNAFQQFPDAGAVGGPLISTQKQEMHSLYETAQHSRFLRFFARIYENVIMEGKLFEPGRLCQSGAYSMGTGLSICLEIKEPLEVDLLTSSSMGIRRKVLQELNGFDEQFYFNHADGDLFIRMKKRGYKLIFHPKVKALHHVKTGLSRHPYYIGRDTAYFLLKDIRPNTISGWFRFLLNIIFLNGYWFYKIIQIKDLKQLHGFFGFLSGGMWYLKNFISGEDGK